VTITALTLNTFLSYTLIFGKLGLPALGVHGAAIAVLSSRVVECSVLLWLTYRKNSPAAGKIKELFGYNRQFACTVLKPVLPVVGNEILWSLGITAYNVVYARLGTESFAAMNIMGSIEQLAFVLFQGIGHACAIMVGNRIGAGEEEQAFRYAARSETLGILGGGLVGLIILASRPFLLSLYNVSPQVLDYVYRVLTIMALLLWLRVSNMILYIGIIRSGGDTRFGFLMDGVVIWVVGVPLAFIGAFILHLPVYWVYFLVMSEELTKWALGIYRFLSRKWIHNLAQTVSE
jgi:putative MATE family efflux protein